MQHPRTECFNLKFNDIIGMYLWVILTTIFYLFNKDGPVWVFALVKLQLEQIDNLWFNAMVIHQRDAILGPKDFQLGCSFICSKGGASLLAHLAPYCLEIFCAAIQCQRCAWHQTPFLFLFALDSFWFQFITCL